MSSLWKWALTLGFVVFLGYVVWISVVPVQVECEVCLDFDGERVCRMGAGPTEEEARRAAQESACGGNVSGMAELINCRGRPPDRVQCQAR